MSPTQLRAAASTLALIPLLLFGAACDDEEPAGPGQVNGITTGLYVLRSVGGKSLPAVVYDDTVRTPEGEFHLKVFAISGELELTGTGRYAQSVRLHAYVDGDRAPIGRWVDRGEFQVNLPGVHFESSYIQNVQFDAMMEGRTLETRRDHVGEGRAVLYRYERDGAP